MHEVVHDIDGQAGGFRPGRHRNADIAGAGTQDRNHPVEIGRQRIARRQFDPRHLAGIQSAEIMMAVGGKPADARAGRRQQAQFRPRQFAAADEQDGTGLQIEKHRKESHADTRVPNFWG